VHSCRHAYATHLLRARNGPAPWHPVLLGHSHSNTTARYANINKVSPRSTGNRIETLHECGFQLRWVEES